MEKVKYKIDPFNRLVITGTGEDSGIPKFRQVLDGRFKIDDDSSLCYEVKAPVAEKETIPHKIKLTGKWSLESNYDLTMTLDESGRQTFVNKITLKCAIKDVYANSLLFAVTTTAKDNTETTYGFELKGTWKADKTNRLTFDIKKENGADNTITFDGVWEIDNDHQVVYKYEKNDLVTKTNQLQTLTFKGHWDITRKDSLSYVLSANTNSVFTFTMSAIHYKEDYIQCELDIAMETHLGPFRQIITISGSWKMVKDVGLTFEIKYADNKVESIKFGAEAKITDNDTVTFSLKSGLKNNDLSAELKLSHSILNGDGEIFLKALKSSGELGFYVGGTWKW